MLSHSAFVTELAPKALTSELSLYPVLIYRLSYPAILGYGVLHTDLSCPLLVFILGMVGA